MMKQCLVSHAIVGMPLISLLLTGCGEKKSEFSFQSPEEALAVCRAELSNARSVSGENIDDVSKATARWLVLQDSAFSCFMRDTLSDVNNPMVADLFNVADSFRAELTAKALSRKRSMGEILAFKLQTANGRAKMLQSADYKAAEKFYADMDGSKTYPDVATTLKEYYTLLDGKISFKREGELYDFIRKEDRCFQSLLRHLPVVPPEDLRKISTKTSTMFDDLYRSTSADMDNKVNERVSIYLSMRFNRRVVQNAMTCRHDIQGKIPLDDELANTYRWMILQPYISIDYNSMAVMTNEQVKQLTALAEELPELLAYIDGKDLSQNAPEENEKLTDMLNNYFLKMYLKSIL